MTHKTQIIALISLLISIYVSAQENLPKNELVTDRPDQTESAVTVPLHHLQLETGFVQENDELLGNVFSNSTLLRFGVLNNMELRIAAEWLNYTKGAFGSSTKPKGWAAPAVGIKIAISEQNGLLPEMALLSHIALPRTGTDAFQTNYMNPDAILAFAYTVSENASLGANLGAQWDDSGQTAGFYALVLGLSYTERLGIFLETYGYFVRNTDLDSRIDAGLTYLIMDNLQLDFSFGFGLSDISPDNFLGFGVSYRIPN